MKTRLIAITGGIGAGKSVVSRMLRTMSYPVFDCDSEAKALMDSSAEIKARIAADISQEVICGGTIDRKQLAAIVFDDAGKLAALNAIVHGAVKERIAEWAEACTQPIAFVETAIMRSSGLDKIIDTEWRVEAPEDIRVARVQARNGLPAEAVRARIEAQAAEYPDAGCKEQTKLTIFCNDGISALLPQLLDALKKTGAEV